MITITKVLSSESSYEAIYEKYYEKVVKDFKSRKKKLKVKLPSGEIVEMRLSKFLINMVFWRPFMVFKVPKELTTDWIIETNNLNSDIIANVFDEVIEKFLNNTNQIELNYCLSRMITELGFYSLDFNSKIGNTISLRSFIMISKENPKFRDLIYTRFNNDDINTAKIEKDLSKKTNELLDILSNKDNCFKDYIKCKEGINKNQLTQFMINIGAKPDLKDNVYPRIINTNFITEGMKTVSDYFINCSGGRKAAITNHSKTKKSGYLMRKLSMLCMNVELDNKFEDCGSKNYVEIELDSESTLTKMDKRYYLNNTGELELFRYDKEKSKELLGKTLKFRSPITCACENGIICKTCYGDLSKINYDIHVGILAIEILTSQVTQKMLNLMTSINFFNCRVKSAANNHHISYCI